MKIWKRRNTGSFVSRLRDWVRLLAIGALISLPVPVLSSTIGADGHIWRGKISSGPLVLGDSPDAACRDATDRFNAPLPDHKWIYLGIGVPDGEPPRYYGCLMLLPNGVKEYWGAAWVDIPCANGYALQPDGSCQPARPPTQTCVGHPVMPGTGTKILVESDNAGSRELPLTRSYRSSVLFGPASAAGQWYFGWQRELDVGAVTSNFSQAQISVLRDNGEVYIFKSNGAVWQAPGTRDTLRGTVDSTGKITGWQYTNANTSTVEVYDQKGKLLSVRERNGRATTLTYDAKSQLSQVTAPSGRSLTFAYDGQGRVITVAAPDGAITKYAYNASGMLSTVTWPDNTTRQYVYEDTHFPTALTGVIDEAGVRYATYAYDDQGRAITSELTAGADRYQFQYQSNGQTTVLTPDGGSSVYSFLKQNGVLLPTAVSAPCPLCGNTALNTSYDTNNNATSKTGYDGSTTTYSYDALGRETRRVVGAGTADAKTTTTEWDPQQWLVTRVAAPNQLEAFSYDAKGNLLSHTVTPTGDASGSQGFSAAASGDAERTEWTYGANGQVLTATDSKGSTIVGTWTFTYDSNGNLLTLTNPSGQTGRIVQYDLAGRVLEAVDTEGLTHKLSYNARGWLTDRQIGNLKIHYDYDPIGQRIAVTGPEDTSARYVYDAAHRLIEIFDNLTIPQAANVSTLASPFGVEQTQRSGAETLSLVTRVKSVLVKSWNSALSWLKHMLSEFVRSAHAQVVPGSGTGIGYKPPMPVPTGSQSINAWPRPEDEIDPNVGSRRMPPEIAVMKGLLQVQQACSAAIGTVLQVFDRSTPPGDCDPVTHNKLRDDVDDKCKNNGTQRCLGTDARETLLAKLDVNRACALARTLLMKKCYRGGDEGHKDADINAWKAVAKCEGFLQ